MINIPSRETQPDWKIESLLKQALKVCKQCMIPGRDAAVDEQTNNYQRKHKEKRKLDEKKNGH